MTNTKLTIAQIYQGAEAVQSRRDAVQKVLDADTQFAHALFDDDDFARARAEQSAITACEILVEESKEASRDWDFHAAGEKLNSAYAANGELPPIPDAGEAGYALHAGQHPAQRSE